MITTAHLHYQLDPDNGAPVLLMVHGLLSSRNHWMLNLDRLRLQFRLLRVDLPGHGASEAVACGTLLHPDQLMQALENLRVACGVERMALCGQSFGAGLTLRYALAFPDRVIGQVFTNATAALSDHEAEASYARLASRIASLRSDGTAALLAEPVHPRRARRFPEALRKQLEQDAASMNPAAYADLLEFGLTHLGLGADLHRISVPTLLINGLWERRFQPLRQRALERIPDLHVVDLEGGHSINVEQPQAFDTAVLQFFQKVSAQRPDARTSMSRTNLQT